MTGIYPIPSNRASDIMLSRRLLAQLRLDQRELYGVQDQVSTGRAFSRPSQDPQRSVRAMTLQRVIEYKEQYQINLETSTSFLASSETALTSVMDKLRDVRGSVLTGVNEPTTPEQRAAIVEELRASLDYLVDVGNTSFRGRYLFSGAGTSIIPYEKIDNQIHYYGNEQRLQSYVSEATLFETNVPGQDVFGGYSEDIVSAIQFGTGLSENTRLDELRGGEGVSLGTIRVSDGTNFSDIDLRNARSVGDVIRLIRNQAPKGRAVDVHVEGDYLKVAWLDSIGGPISIEDLDGGTTARDLGIVTPVGTPPEEVIGESLEPKLTRQTRLEDLLGSRASTYIRSLGENNDIFVEAIDNGESNNGVRFQLVNDELLDAGPAVAKGAEYVEFDGSARAARAGLGFSGAGNDLILTASTPGRDFNNVEIRIVSGGLSGDNATAIYDASTKRLDIAVDSTGATSVQSVVNAINAEGTFVASPDASDPSDGSFNPGSLINPLDINQLTSNTTQSGGDANTYYVYVNPLVSTANDAVSALNSSAVFTDRFEASLDTFDSQTGANDGSGLLTFADSYAAVAGSGEVLDQVGGLLISVGTQDYRVNLQDATTLEDLVNRIHQSGAPVRADVDEQSSTLRVRALASGVNFSIGENGGTTASQLGLRTLTESTELSELNFGRGIRRTSGEDFIIHRNDGVELSIDVSAASTIGDVLSIINDHPDNQDADRIEARLAVTGNGIELVDDNPPSSTTIFVEAGFGSQAAEDLGLIPPGEKFGFPGGDATPASLEKFFSPPNDKNTGFRIEATAPGTSRNGVDVIIADGGAIGDTASVVFDEIAGTLTVTVDPTATSINSIISAINTEGEFEASLLTTNGINNGTGVIPETGLIGTTSGGSSSSDAARARGDFSGNPPGNLNTGISIAAASGGTQWNGVEVVLVDALVGDTAAASYDSVARRLTIQVDAGATSANQIVNAVNAEGTFEAELSLGDDPTNDGTGIVGRTGTVTTLQGGGPEVLGGRDPNPQEVSSIFNSIQRLIDVFSSDLDLREAERAFALFDDDFDRVTQAMAELGAKSRALDVLDQRLEDDMITLRASLSQEIDVDLVEAVSNLTVQQTAYQASLQMIGQSFQLTLLNFL